MLSWLSVNHCTVIFIHLGTMELLHACSLLGSLNQGYTVQLCGAVAAFRANRERFCSSQGAHALQAYPDACMRSRHSQGIAATMLVACSAYCLGQAPSAACSMPAALLKQSARLVSQRRPMHQGAVQCTDAVQVSLCRHLAVYGHGILGIDVPAFGTLGSVDEGRPC